MAAELEIAQKQNELALKRASLKAMADTEAAKAEAAVCNDVASAAILSPLESYGNLQKLQTSTMSFFEVPLLYIPNNIECTIPKVLNIHSG